MGSLFPNAACPDITLLFSIEPLIELSEIVKFPSVSTLAPSAILPNTYFEIFTAVIFLTAGSVRSLVSCAISKSSLARVVILSVVPSISKEEIATLFVEVILFNLESLIEPSSIALVIPNALTLRLLSTVSIEEPSAFTSNAEPFSNKPLPAVIWPAPLNCVKVKLFVPTTSDPLSDVQTNPLSPFAVPSWTNIKIPAADEDAAMSVALTGAPEACTI